MSYEKAGRASQQRHGGRWSWTQLAGSGESGEEAARQGVVSRNLGLQGPTGCGEDFVTWREMGAMVMVGVSGSREPRREVSAVVWVGGGAAGSGWGLWDDRWLDSGDAVRVQPIGLTENGCRCERQRGVKVRARNHPEG